MNLDPTIAAAGLTAAAALLMGTAPRVTGWLTPGSWRIHLGIRRKRTSAYLAALRGARNRPAR